MPGGVCLALAAAGPDLAAAAWRMLVVAYRETEPEDAATLLRVLSAHADAGPSGPRSRPGRLARRLGLIPPNHADDMGARRRWLKRILDEAGTPMGI